MKVSVIVPSYNEGANVSRLADRLISVLERCRYEFEILFVDDSRDDTPLILQRMQEADSRIRFLHRDRERGLATAVLAGMRLATGDVFVVMDADLQHPPELVPELLEAVCNGYDLVIPSRFVPGGDDGGLNRFRKIVSWTARMIARVALKKVRPITDPTSGFFAVRRESVEISRLNPTGWKILLEIIVRGNPKSWKEIPYGFIARDLGDSKMGLQEQWRYLYHILRLVAYSDEDSRFWKFCLVGASGVVVNTTVYVLLVRGHWNVTAAFLAASIVSMTSNFILNNRFTWKTGAPDSAWKRYAKFLVVSTVGIGLSSGLVYLLYHWLHLHYLASGWLGILGGVIWNFAANDHWTFKRKNRSGESPSRSARSQISR